MARGGLMGNGALDGGAGVARVAGSFFFYVLCLLYFARGARRFDGKPSIYVGGAGVARVAGVSFVCAVFWSGEAWCTGH